MGLEQADVRIILLFAFALVTVWVLVVKSSDNLARKTCIKAATKMFDSSFYTFANAKQTLGQSKQ